MDFATLSLRVRTWPWPFQESKCLLHSKQFHFLSLRFLPDKPKTWEHTSSIPNYANAFNPNNLNYTLMYKIAVWPFRIQLHTLFKVSNYSRSEFPISLLYSNGMKESLINMLPHESIHSLYEMNFVDWNLKFMHKIQCRRIITEASKTDSNRNHNLDRPPLKNSVL